MDSSWMSAPSDGREVLCQAKVPVLEIAMDVTVYTTKT